MKEFTLKELCEECNVTRRAVQGYEKYGLLHSCGKNKYGYLLYSEAEKVIVTTIKNYQNFGFSVKEICDFLSLDDEKQKEILYEKLKKLEKQKENIQNYITELKENIESYDCFKKFKKDWSK